MKKGTVIMLVILVSLNFLYAKWETDFSLDFDYSDNVFKLSDDDLKLFDDGNSDFDFVETSDDIILTPALKIGYEHDFSKKFSISPSFKYSYDFYLQNNEKNNESYMFSLSTSTGILNSNFSYIYYPKNYSRMYEDTDGSGEFEKYEYEKDLLKYSANFRINDFIPMFYYKFENLKFNEYFTEHDGIANTFGLGMKYVFSHMYLKGFYYYKNFEADVHDDLDVENIDYNADLYLRDDTYSSNTYFIELESKKIKLSKTKSFRPSFSFELENKYYQTDLPIEADPIHSTRVDDTVTVNFETIFYLTKSMDVSLKYSHEYRNTDSDWSGLSELKDYSENQIRLNISYKLD